MSSFFQRVVSWLTGNVLLQWWRTMKRRAYARDIFADFMSTSLTGLYLPGVTENEDGSSTIPTTRFMLTMTETLLLGRRVADMSAEMAYPSEELGVEPFDEAFEPMILEMLGFVDEDEEDREMAALLEFNPLDVDDIDDDEHDNYDENED